jgi:hypothetical protein
MASLVERDEELELLDVHGSAWRLVMLTLTKSAIDVIDHPVRHIDWTPPGRASSVVTMPFQE